jgi:hypothetical protein
MYQEADATKSHPASKILRGSNHKDLNRRSQPKSNADSHRRQAVPLYCSLIIRRR